MDVWMDRWFLFALYLPYYLGHAFNFFYWMLLQSTKKEWDLSPSFFFSFGVLKFFIFFWVIL